MNLKNVLSLKLLLLLVLLPSHLLADTFTQGVFQLSKAPLDKHYEFVAQYPASSDTQQAIEWPKGCIALQGNQYQRSATITRTYLIRCDAELKNGDVIDTPYSLDAAIFDIQLGAWQSRAILNTDRIGAQLILQAELIQNRAILAIAIEYLAQGVAHIWFGWDHLAFVFCLCVLTIGLRQLLWVITAFTIGHSLSMGLSFFKLVEVPIAPVEAVIALSIVLMAKEAWLQSENRQHTHEYRILLVVTLFGLIHGLGFASALENIGIADNERAPALVFFNLGVEIGQVLFVLLVLWLFARLRNLQRAHNVSKFALLCVGTAGSFWTIERISAFNWQSVF